VGDQYTSVDDLPADNWFATQLVVRLSHAPESWPVGTPVQLFIHAPADTSGAWQAEPIAFTQGTVTPRQFVNGALFLMGDASRPGNGESYSAAASAIQRGSADPTLPKGDYLVKVYVDMEHRLDERPGVFLGDREFAGQVELKKAKWRPGFRRAEIVSGQALK
jgi:hypothetical protein